MKFLQFFEKNAKIAIFRIFPKFSKNLHFWPFGPPRVPPKKPDFQKNRPPAQTYMKKILQIFKKSDFFDILYKFVRGGLSIICAGRHFAPMVTREFFKKNLQKSRIFLIFRFRFLIFWNSRNFVFYSIWYWGGRKLFYSSLILQYLIAIDAFFVRGFNQNFENKAKTRTNFFWCWNWLYFIDGILI